MVSSLHPARNDLENTMGHESKASQRHQQTGSAMNRTGRTNRTGSAPQQREAAESVKSVITVEEGVHYAANHEEEEEEDPVKGDPMLGDTANEEGEEAGIEEEHSKMFEERPRDDKTGSQLQTPHSKREGTGGEARKPHENMGHLKQIAAGRSHILHLTRDGFVFSYGSGTFSAAGHGGAKSTLIP